MPHNTPDLLLTHARLVTLSDDAGYGLIDDGALACREGRIVWIGPSAQVPTMLRDAHEVHDCAGMLVTPALIDCHTHLVFGGDRAGEFEQRLLGVSYEDIARQGGGIVSSVRATRAASEDALLDLALARARALMADGVATLEIKSGYGLELDSELRMLRVARRVGEVLGITVKTTFLAAHAVPPEFAGRADDYIAHVCETLLPAAHAEGLVDAVDAFCERIGFTPQQTARVFAAARALGLPVKLHADQLSDSDGAALVASFDGLSADHVEYSSEDGVRMMAAHGSTAVLLPGAFLCLRETRVPPIEQFRAHGVPMAVATDANPGTSPLLSVRLAMALACIQFRLSPEESLRGATCHAARALGLSDRGRLVVGQRADIAVWRARQPAELCYWLGGDLLEGLYVNARRAH
ncbi:MAG: imidazolonepropionase [Xanthomonadales bacterium]|nr:imidazolonepropionase [Xanthomonadales bacterium]